MRPCCSLSPPAPGVQWRPPPPAFLAMFAPWLEGVTPLLVHNATQFGPRQPPPALTLKRYTRDFNEVKAYGSATSAVRTADADSQRALLLVPPRPVQRRPPRPGDRTPSEHRAGRENVRAIYDGGRRDHLGLAREVRLRILNPGDRHQPRGHRPRAATDADTAWTPLKRSPPYPDYVSGYNGYTAAFSAALEKLFGTNIFT